MTLSRCPGFAAAARPSSIARHWFATFVMIYGAWVWLPFAAPVLMRVGWEPAARALYLLYSFFCHQLPERSFFMFGPKLMYSLSEIQVVAPNTVSPFALRHFIGTPNMGWKVAWSDRMIAFYASIWVLALRWHSARPKPKPLPVWGCILLLLPMVLDGGTHAISDLAGIGQGVRDTNAWLAVLTSHGLPASFYVGDALGSFNSIMRLVTGVLAGLGLAGFAVPYMEASFAESQR